MAITLFNDAPLFTITLKLQISYSFYLFLSLKIINHYYVYDYHQYHAHPQQQHTIITINIAGGQHYQKILKTYSAAVATFWVHHGIVIGERRRWWWWWRERWNGWSLIVATVKCSPIAVWCYNIHVLWPRIVGYIVQHLLVF